MEDLDLKQLAIESYEKIITQIANCNDEEKKKDLRIQLEVVKNESGLYDMLSFKIKRSNENG